VKLDVSSGSTPEPQHFLECLSDFFTSLTDHRPLGIAVSGGSDSLGLLHGLAAVAPPHRLVALTVDHGLRSAAADEARWVKAQCKQLGVRHETLKWQNGQPKSGIQAAARAARYRLLGKASVRLGLAAVLTAHTQDDQNETVLMRRARSSSEDAPGLAGIPAATLFDERMWVLRPLLGLSRQTVRDFLRSRGVSDWVEDPSNADRRFERVRVRAQLKGDGPPVSGSDAAQIAMARLRLASAAAELIDANCHVDAKSVVWLQQKDTTAIQVVMAALEALIDWQGAASSPLDRRGKATLSGFLSSTCGSDQGGVMSLGRTLVRRKGPSLTVERERRNIDELVLPPGECGVWDRRFEICNRSNASPLCVSAAANAGVLPCFTRNQGEYSFVFAMDDGVIGGFTCLPLLGRSSRILPVHQLPVGQALARLAGRSPLPECPWSVSAGIPALTAIKVQ